MSRKYGWRPDVPDKFDKLHVPRLAGVVDLPEQVDHRPVMPPVWNQLELGACTAFGVGGAIAYELCSKGIDKVFTPSFLQLYWCTRAMEGTESYDAGAYIRDACKVGAQQGVASAEHWPYWIQRFRERPSKSTFSDALDTRISSYARVRQNVQDMQATLASEDCIVFGAAIYDSFESEEVARTGKVPMPRRGESHLGGHCMLLCGYNALTGEFLVRNSWGTGWGLQGYCWMPYAYVIDPDLCSDLWAVNAVTP